VNGSAVERKEVVVNLKNFEYVLVLATKPAGKPSIIDWRPFGQATLDEIINKHNKDNVASLQQTPKWPPNVIEEYGQFMAVANYDLSEMDRIGLAQFRDIKFVFANLEELAAASSTVERVKAAMDQARRVYYLVQISTKPPRPSQLARFTPSPVLPSQPEVIDDQSKLEQWLATLYQFYNYAISETILSPPSSRSGQGGTSGSSISTAVAVGESKPHSWSRLFMDYRLNDLSAGFEGGEGVLLQRSPVDLASEVRDTAIQKGFTEQKTRALARKAVLQAKALSYVRASVLNNLNLKTGDELFLDCLRKPMEDITTDDEYLERTPTIDVVTVKLAQPSAALSKTQSELCAELRLSKTNRHVLLRSSPETLKKIEGLKNIIETHHTGLTLPFDATDLLA
jgi:hypothetical protein